MYTDAFPYSIPQTKTERKGTLKMKLLKWFLFTLIALALLLVPLPMMAETAPAEQVQGLADQLTLQDISALNKGQEKVYSHNGRVTLVDGTCSPLPIKDAAQVVSAMRGT